MTKLFQSMNCVTGTSCGTWALRRSNRLTPQTVHIPAIRFGCKAYFGAIKQCSVVELISPQ